MCGLLERSMNKKLGRNDPCPCGSGKKYKKCCLGNLRNEDSLPQKFRFESGSYGDVGAFVPSIACLKLVNPDEWDYYFVLVKAERVHSEEDEASSEAEKDIERAFGQKKRTGSDFAVAEHLRDQGYVSVEGFKIVKN
jgi:hypothetical protein